MESPDLPFELQALAGARRYQEWVARTVTPDLGRRILEVGAGVGNMSAWLPRRERLILTEADPNLLAILRQSEAARDPGDVIRVAPIDLSSDSAEGFASENLDTIVSFNVLEHLEDDESALRRLVALLSASRAPGPRRLVTFVPAHGFAFGGMDRAFGHHRRYDRDRVRFLAARVAPGAELRIRFFNAFGLVGWLWNGRVLGRDRIGSRSIRAFERVCPWLSPFDDFAHATLGLPVGQSLIFVLSWPGESRV